MTVRILVDDFALANPYYAGATIHIYELDGDLLPTATLANLYAGTTGSTLLENPQRLDSEGKFEQPVYVGEPVSTTVTRPDDEGAESETGTQGLVARWRGVWATATIYYPGERVQHPTTGRPYTVLVGHTSAGSIATDIAAERLELEDASLAGFDEDAPSDGGLYVRQDGAWVAVEIDPGVYVAGFDFGPDEPAADTEYRHVLGEAVSIPDNFTGSRGAVTGNPASDAEWIVKLNGSQIGTATIGTGGALTWAFDTPGSPIAGSAGQVLAMRSPAVIPSGLTGPSFTIVADRSA